ncbi:MAG: DJ-1/PfpI family protein [Bacilli bacterium]|nr:DJ-1/PfpI family protein [Bacilli bacterium]
MKKALIIVEHGFEFTEAIGTYDVLRRSGEIIPSFYSSNIKLDNSIDSSMNWVNLLGSHRIDHEAIDKLVEEFDFLVLPGGKLGVENIKKNDLDLVKAFIDEGKHVHAICAAPSILGELGFLKGKKYVCYPGFEKEEFGGDYQEEDGVTIDGTLITARSMGLTIPFGLEIVRLEVGEEPLRKAEKGIFGVR